MIGQILTLFCIPILALRIDFDIQHHEDGILTHT